MSSYVTCTDCIYDEIKALHDHQLVSKNNYYAKIVWLICISSNTKKVTYSWMLIIKYCDKDADIVEIDFATNISFLHFCCVGFSPVGIKCIFVLLKIW